MALPALMAELVEEILLRLPPDEPEHLFRAGAVCKAWRRILLDDSGFRRRYCRFHRKHRPLLGYVHNVSLREGVQFVPTTTFLPPPPPAAASYSYRAIDCRHGRVLIDTSECGPPGFIVWDPTTGDQQHLRFPAHAQENLSSFTGAVLCAVDGCDHLDCHGGPFLVVCVGGRCTEGTHAVGVENTWASVYSSQAGAWSAQTSSIDYYVAAREPSLLIGDALYFAVCSTAILKYDLSRHGLSLIETPRTSYKSVPIDIDGGLGLVEPYRNWIYTWSQQDDGANGVGGWLQHNVVKLETLIPTRRRVIWPPYNSDDVIRFVEGTDTVLFSLNNYCIDQGVFTLDLKSRKVRKVAETWHRHILPYTCFYTPDLAMGKQLSPR
ncbi:unnamed protein product [Urochloa decumbens]|uniref:F-box domain-containing protein n=1 Tax=Urochloa decumbens TaxID=240449 RepID=A0ABC9GZ32_9POAL